MAGCQGQDWASYQDYRPATSGLAFVFVKQTEGLSYVNPKASSQVATARAAGLVVGHYHYPHMANNPATEADRFLSVAKPQPGDVLVLDWEGYDAANRDIAWTRQVQYKAAFIARVRAVHSTLRLGVYCNTDYLNRDSRGEYGDFLWIATAGRPAGDPGISHSWLFHQYSTSGGIDHDFCPLTPAELHSWAHAEENTDMPLTSDDVNKVAAAAKAAVWGAQFPSPTAAPGTNANRAASDFLRWGDQHTADIIKAIRAQQVPALAPEQVTAIASQVAASPALAESVAEKVAEKLAARLQS